MSSLFPCMLLFTCGWTSLREAYPCSEGRTIALGAQLERFVSTPLSMPLLNLQYGFILISVIHVKLITLLLLLPCGLSSDLLQFRGRFWMFLHPLCVFFFGLIKVSGSFNWQLFLGEITALSAAINFSFCWKNVALILVGFFTALQVKLTRSYSVKKVRRDKKGKAISTTGLGGPQCCETSGLTQSRQSILRWRWGCQT
jgi:hypothetical protein